MVALVLREHEMTDNRVLSDEQRESIEKRAHILYSQGDKKLVEAAISDTEQAVLQSPRVQQWKKDAERYQYAKSGTSSGKVDICITRKNWHESDHVILCEDRADIEIDAAMETKP